METYTSHFTNCNNLYTNLSSRRDSHANIDWFQMDIFFSINPKRVENAVCFNLSTTSHNRLYLSIEPTVRPTQKLSYVFQGKPSCVDSTMHTVSLVWSYTAENRSIIPEHTSMHCNVPVYTWKNYTDVEQRSTYQTRLEGLPILEGV